MSFQKTTLSLPLVFASFLTTTGAASLLQISKTESRLRYRFNAPTGSGRSSVGFGTTKCGPNSPCEHSEVNGYGLGDTPQFGATLRMSHSAP